MSERPTTDEVIDRSYAGSRMPLDEVRANRRVVHPDMRPVVQPADEGAAAKFTPAPDDLMAELAAFLTEPHPMLGDVDVSEYPFRLVSRRLKHVLNSTGTELPALARKGTTNPAYMHPDDVKRGVISMSHSWGGASLTDEKVRDIGTPTSRLVSADVGHDPVTGMVVSSAIPVTVEKADVEAAAG